MTNSTNSKAPDIVKTIRLLVLLMLSGIWFAPAALGATVKHPVEEPLFGRWQEYQPGAGVIQFDPDHNMRFYLTKAEGTKKDMRWIEARWTLSAKKVLTLRYFQGRKSHTRTIKLVLKNDELWLTERGRTSKYRRLQGELPAQFNWQ